MDKDKRRVIIAGNWKMNFTPSESNSFINELKAKLPQKSTCEVVLCVPYTNIYDAKSAVAGSCIKLGAQNVHWATSGAFTGEISADMLVKSGVEYVIIGHSERRQYFGESDVTVNMRIKAAAGLQAIVCVGETETERDFGITNEVVSRQMKIALDGIQEDALCNIIIAYEPVWAIGTGKTATAAEAGRVCGIIRDTVVGLYSVKAAESMSILYGGSMNADNAAELLEQYHIDGGLIGGASLKADAFAKIVSYAG